MAAAVSGRSPSGAAAPRAREVYAAVLEAHDVDAVDVAPPATAADLVLPAAAHEIVKLVTEWLIEGDASDHAFLEHPRQVLSRSQLFERVWGYDFGFASNSLDVYVGYLRRKTEAADRPRLIQTVRGVGYALRDT